MANWRVLTLITALVIAALPSSGRTAQPLLLKGRTTIVSTSGGAVDVRLHADAWVRTTFGDSPDLHIEAKSRFAGLALIGINGATSGITLIGGRISNNSGSTTFLAPLPQYPLPGGGNYDFAKTYADEFILPAGDYRLYLFGDSPSKIQINLRGLKGETTIRSGSGPDHRLSYPSANVLSGNGVSENIYSAADQWPMEKRGLLFHALWLGTKMHASGQYFFCHRSGPTAVAELDSAPGCPLADKSIANDRYTNLERDTKLLFQGYAGVNPGEHALGVWYSMQSVVEDSLYVTLWLPYE